jgi:calcineurin-like phosphoesterase family protein
VPLLVHLVNDMATFLTADQHLNHFNIIRYCNRPFATVEEMNETIISNWNAIVTPQDTVYHLGDVAFGNLSIIHRLNGTIHLIRGNHDRGYSDTKLKANGISTVSKVPIEIEIDGVRVLLMHAPITESKTTDIWLCGHVHDSWSRQGKYINVGVDVREFRPIRLAEAIK